jgi:hypothetical protein
LEPRQLKILAPCRSDDGQEDGRLECHLIFRSGYLDDGPKGEKQQPIVAVTLKITWQKRQENGTEETWADYACFSYPFTLDVDHPAKEELDYICTFESALETLEQLSPSGIALRFRKIGKQDTERAPADPVILTMTKVRNELRGYIHSLQPNGTRQRNAAK